MIIREWEIKDFMGIISLIQNELGYDDISSDIYDRIMRIYRDDNYQTFVAEDNGTVVGFVGIMRGLALELDGEYVRVIALAVSGSYRNNGVGTMLETHVEDYAHQTGANSIVISSGLRRLDAHSFYEKRGYAKKGYSFIKLLETEEKFSYDDLYMPIPSRLGTDDDAE